MRTYLKTSTTDYTLTERRVDAVIRFTHPEELSPDAARLRKSVDFLMVFAGVTPAQMSLVRNVLGSGWNSWAQISDNRISEHNRARAYATALRGIAREAEHFELVPQGDLVL